MLQASPRLSSLAIAAMLASASQGVFAQEITLTHGSIIDGQYSMYRLGGENLVRLNLGNTVVAVLNAITAKVDSIAPATTDIRTNSRGKFSTISVDMPVISLTGAFVPNSHTFSPSQIASSGSLRLQTEDDNLTTTGGGLVIANLHIDLSSQRVYGDLTGGNGVGVQQQVHLWNYGNVLSTPTGPAQDCFLSYPNGNACNIQLNPELTFQKLTITTQAFGLFSQSLGLTQDGISAFQKITDYGTIVATVPEASTVIQMGLGLAALGLLAVRRRRSSH